MSVDHFIYNAFFCRSLFHLIISYIGRPTVCSNVQETCSGIWNVSAKEYVKAPVTSSGRR